MKIRYFLFLLTVALLLGSCAAPKVAYFTDLKPGTAEEVLNPLEIRVRPEDKISILVNSMVYISSMRSNLHLTVWRKHSLSENNL